MDGTLINSGADITASVNHVRQTVYNLPEVSVDYVTDAINRDQQNLAMMFYETPRYEPGTQQVFEAHYHEQCVQTVRLYEGIAELLSTLTRHNVHLAVATNAPTQFALRMLGKLNITETFSHVIGSDQVTTPKPNPEMIHTILKRLHHDSQKDFSLMVGDSEKDMEAGRRAGIATAFVTWGFTPQGNGDFTCQRPEDISAIILKQIPDS